MGNYTMLAISTKYVSINLVSRPELLGHSNLAILPTVRPEHPLYSLEYTHGQRSIVDVDGVQIGGPEIVLMAGPCSLENEAQIWESAHAAHAAGAKILRGGAFKPRTSPYSFQGLGEFGLKLQRAAADALGMKVVTEATGESNVRVVAAHAEIIQIGARNSQNFELLVKAAQAARTFGRAILYKRGAAMSIGEWLEGAEYLLAAGLPTNKLMLCERGTGTNGSVDLDTQGIEKVRQITHLPIIADPTHASMVADQVPGKAVRAIQAGADALIIEVHPRPHEALSDGPRALLPETLIQVAQKINDIAPTGRYFRNQHELAPVDSV